MRSALLVLPILVALGSGASLSQNIDTVMSADEVEKEILGVHLSGVTGLNDQPWSECIEPDGDTVFNHAGRQSVGQISIRPDGVACFNYENVPSGRNCYSVSKTGAEGYQFTGVEPGANFLATEVQRGIETCPKGPPAIG